MDRFDDPVATAANWTSVSGTWTAANSTYGVSNRVTDNFTTVAAVNALNYGNFTLSYNLLSGNDGGLLFHTDAGVDNGLVLIVSPDNNDFHFTYRTNGTFGAILGGNHAIGAPVGQILRVDLTAFGNSYTATISAAGSPPTPLATFTLSGDAIAANYTSGRVGLYENGLAGTERFDTFNVVPEPSTWAMLSGGLGLLAGARFFRRARRA